jgi:hypothetical protein
VTSSHEAGVAGQEHAALCWSRQHSETTASRFYNKPSRKRYFLSCLLAQHTLTQSKSPLDWLHSPSKRWIRCGRNELVSLSTRMVNIINSHQMRWKSKRRWMRNKILTTFRISLFVHKKSILGVPQVWPHRARFACCAALGLLRASLHLVRIYSRAPIFRG